MEKHSPGLDSGIESLCHTVGGSDPGSRTTLTGFRLRPIAAKLRAIEWAVKAPLRLNHSALTAHSIALGTPLSVEGSNYERHKSGNPFTQNSGHSRFWANKSQLLGFNFGFCRNHVRVVITKSGFADPICNFHAISLKWRLRPPVLDSFAQ